MFTLEVFEAKKAVFEGVNVLQVPGSRFIAVPHSGKYSCKHYGIIDLDDREDFYHPSIPRKEVAEFLACLMRIEKEESSQHEHVQVDEIEEKTIDQLSLF